MLIKIAKSAFNIITLIALLVLSFLAVALSFNESLKDGLVILAVIGLLLNIYNRVDQIAETQGKGDHS